jgi:betaine lipid synthase
MSPISGPDSKLTVIPDLTIGPSALERAAIEGEGYGTGYEMTLHDAGAPLSPFHYQLRKAWRMPYLEEKIHQEFRTHIYGWVSLTR